MIGKLLVLGSDLRLQLSDEYFVWIFMCLAFSASFPNGLLTDSKISHYTGY